MIMMIRVAKQHRYASRKSTRLRAFPTTVGSQTGRKVFIRLRTEFSLPHYVLIPPGRSAKDSLSYCRIFPNKSYCLLNQKPVLGTEEMKSSPYRATGKRSRASGRTRRTGQGA